ncbi:hypothetical protein RCC89_05160 [Cytophagaceae bacterium ABcell3]|nr:hypothetical protein RCC89_05160 [Cytophagaceae bacterium ABcell3]
MNVTFNNTFKYISSAAGYSGSCNAEVALSLWKDFVEECKEGYSWTVWEYMNEVDIRTIIQKVLDHPDIKNFPDYQEYKQEVLKYDEEFRGIILTKDYFDNDYWWERKLPKCGYGDFIDTLRNAYGIYDVVECL